jgi:hypothetical protein
VGFAVIERGGAHASGLADQPSNLTVPSELMPIALANITAPRSATTNRTGCSSFDSPFGNE